MPADTNPELPAGPAPAHAADPAELSDEQLASVAGGVGAMQMSRQAPKAMGDLQSGDPNEAPTLKISGFGG